MIATDRHEEAIGHLEQVIALQPLAAHAWFLLGKAYLLAGDRAQAIAIMNDLRRHFPEEAEALRALLED